MALGIPHISLKRQSGPILADKLIHIQVAFDASSTGSSYQQSAALSAVLKAVADAKSLVHEDNIPKKIKRKRGDVRQGDPAEAAEASEEDLNHNDFNPELNPALFYSDESAQVCTDCGHGFLNVSCNSLD